MARDPRHQADLQQRLPPLPHTEGEVGVTHIDTVALRRIFDEITEIMEERGKKYGPGNISRHGLEGILVRLDDKTERLNHSQHDHADESYRDAWRDVVGYGLIALLWLDGAWPGSDAWARKIKTDPWLDPSRASRWVRP